MKDEPQDADGIEQVTTLAHLSDIHFGRLAYPHIVGTLVDEVNSTDVDLVIVSGDLTQRARRREFEAAAAMLAAFDAPTLVVPGNHDVYAWWYPFARLFRPVRRYQRYISHNLSPQLVLHDVAILGINSAHGATVKGGRVTTEAQQRITAFFSEQPADYFKVLVVHHHLTLLPALAPHDVVRGGATALETAMHAGVDLILCGHLHVAHIEPPTETTIGKRPLIVSAGTATSSRGRGTNRGKNLYNLIRITAGHVHLEGRRYEPGLGRFVLEAEESFERATLRQE